MVRISQILKESLKKGKKEKPARASLKEKEQQGPGVSSKEVPVRVASIMQEKTGALSGEEARKIYEELLSIMNGILQGKPTPQSIDSHLLVQHTEKMIDCLRIDGNQLVILAFTEEPVNGNYLPSHSLNTCIYSLELGLGLNFDKAHLLELGVYALLHDVGMVQHLPLVNQPRKLTSEEFQEIKNHPQEGAEIIKQVIGDISEVVKKVSGQEHERVDGTGYPKGLEGERIHKYAQIVGLIDVYEAMTHSRAYRERRLSIEAIQEILHRKGHFEYRLVKILLERVGIYPPGSMVKLSTKEIALVVKANPHIPLRPTIEIICDTKGHKLEERKRIDLAAHSALHIISLERSGSKAEG